MTLEERAAALQKITDLPRAAADAVAGLSNEQLDTPYRDGGWTVRQVIHHLVDSHVNAYVRTRLILTESHPTLKPYDQDAWAGLYDADAAPVEWSLSILAGLHQRWVQLLESLEDSAWSRTAYHPENGDMTLVDILALYSGHGEHHVDQIRALRERRGW